MKGSFPKPFFIDFWKRFGHPWASKSKHSVQYRHQFWENRLFQKSTPKSIQKGTFLHPFGPPFLKKCDRKGGLKETNFFDLFWDGSWGPLPLKPGQRGTGKHMPWKLTSSVCFPAGITCGINALSFSQRTRSASLRSPQTDRMDLVGSGRIW